MYDIYVYICVCMRQEEILNFNQSHKNNSFDVSLTNLETTIHRIIFLSLNDK